jgi:hypothetical protein
MKKMIVGLTLIGLVGVLGISSAWAGRVGERQIHQGRRIQQGVHSGALTCNETRYLAREQHRVQHAKRHAWSDGHMTARERVRLEKMQDRSSRHIYRLKHHNRHQR